MQGHPVRPGGLARALVSVLLLAGLTACAAPPPWRAVPNYRVRWSDVERVTLIPPLVFMRSLKPCVRALLILLGW